jgi:hypothetical protein
MNQLQSDILRALVAYWRAAAAGAAMPGRAAIDPVTMPRVVLPHVFIAAVEAAADGTARFRYTLIGTAVVALTGRDVTGREIGPDIYGANAETVLQPFRQVLAERRPVSVHLTTWWRDLPFETESVFLPLGAGGRIDRILGGVVRLVPHHETLPKDQASAMTVRLRALGFPEA